MEAVPTTSEPNQEGDYQVKPGSGKHDPLAQLRELCNAVMELPAEAVPPNERSLPPPPGSSFRRKQSVLGLQHAVTQVLQFSELNDESLMSLTQNC
ncbi:hypothetical protein ACM43_14210 [Bradyrhizobium sp. CCBAU 45321]|nr:hypothetical protein [Bradyrhizobium sp. CCBAU 45321]